MSILFLFLLLSIIICEDNVTTVTLPTGNCILLLQYYSISRFNLINCYNFDKHTIQSTASWTDCTSRCCSPNKTYGKVRASIDSCDSDRKAYVDSTSGNSISPQDIMTLIMFIILSISAIILIIGIICKMCHQQEIENKIRYMWSNPFHVSNDIYWVKENRKEDEICPVCTSEDPDVQFDKCKHMMHWDCWKGLYRTNVRCPLCRSDDILTLKIRCAKCKNAYFKCWNSDMQAQAANPKLVCKDCK